MSVSTTTRSARAVTLQARAPRLILLALAVVVCLAGLRSILAGPPRATATTTVVHRGSGVAAPAFAESFARAYLSWDPRDAAGRRAQLAQYLTDAADPDGGLEPTATGRQTVSWTTVAGVRDAGDETIVTVGAQTSNGMTYLAVPVRQDAHGALAIAEVPSLVGPPTVDRTLAAPSRVPVADRRLQAVVQRAVSNYLSGSRDNLLADLAPDAVVSLPAQHLTVADSEAPTWIVVNRTVALIVHADDDHGNAWTLRYEVAVVLRDRWYVRTLTVNPSAKDNDA